MREETPEKNGWIEKHNYITKIWEEQGRKGVKIGKVESELEEISTEREEKKDDNWYRRKINQEKAMRENKLEWRKKSESDSRSRGFPNKERELECVRQMVFYFSKKLHEFTLIINRRKIFDTCQILNYVSKIFDTCQILIYVSKTTGINWLILPVTICFTKGLSHARFSLKRQWIGH